jgi:hypothetical protein
MRLSGRQYDAGNANVFSLINTESLNEGAEYYWESHLSTVDLKHALNTRSRFISLCHYLTLPVHHYPTRFTRCLDESRSLIAANYDPNRTNMNPWRVGRRLHSKYNKHESYSWGLYKYKTLSGQAVTFGTRVRKKNHKAASKQCRCIGFSREHSGSPQKRATSAASRQLHSIFPMTSPFARSDILRKATRAA